MKMVSPESLSKNLRRYKSIDQRPRLETISEVTAVAEKTVTTSALTSLSYVKKPYEQLLLDHNQDKDATKNLADYSK